MSEKCKGSATPEFWHLFGWGLLWLGLGLGIGSCSMMESYGIAEKLRVEKGIK